MKTIHLVAVWIVMVLSTAKLQAATVLFQQTPISIGNPATGFIGISSTQSNDPAEPRAKVWDNFVIATKSTVTSLTWQGAYNNTFNSNANLRGEVDFIVQVFGNLAGDTPDLGNVLFSTTLDGGTAGRNDGTDVTTSIIPDQLQQDGGAIVSYEADVEIMLAPGDYWLSIVAEQTFPSPHPDEQPNDPDAHLDPTWSWIFSSDGDNLAYQFDELFDAFEPGFRFTASSCPITACDTTFTISGVVIPEPTALTLLGTSVLGLLGFRRRRSPGLLSRWLRTLSASP